MRLLNDLLNFINMFMRLSLNWFHLMVLLEKYMRIKKRRRRLYKPHLLIERLVAYRWNHFTRDIWAMLQSNWSNFYWMTGETPQTFNLLVMLVEQCFYPVIRRGRHNILDLRNQILLTFIWLRNYPTMQTLSTLFGIPVSCTHRIIHKMCKVLHSYLVPKYIHWHSMNHWRNLRGIYPEWPNVVAILDCTPFKISKPAGPMQRMFYRKDRHCFFLNWLVIVDTLGYVVLSHPVFIGRVHDNMCLGHINLPVLPAGLQIMADQGFKHNLPIIVLPRHNQPQIPRLMRRAFKSQRSMIEHCFGILKNAYSAAGTLRFRSRKWFGPIICNLACALFNRNRLIYKNIRNATGYHYM